MTHCRCTVDEHLEEHACGIFKLRKLYYFAVVEMNDKLNCTVSF